MSKPVEDLSKSVAEIMQRHSIKPMDMAVGLIRCAAALYLRGQSECGKQASARDFGAFANATFGVFEEVLGAKRAS